MRTTNALHPIMRDDSLPTASYPMSTKEKDVSQSFQKFHIDISPTFQDVLGIVKVR